MASIKRFSTVLFVLVLICVLGQGAIAEPPRYHWTVATLAPKGVGWAKQMEDMFLPTIQNATDNAVYIKIFWGGVMGDDEDYIKQMEVGQLDGAGVTGQGATLMCPEWSVVEIPFLFNNYDEVDYVRQKMLPTFERLMESKGYKLISWIDQDFDRFYSLKHKFTRLEDFSKARIVTWYGDLEQRVLERLGATPIPVDVPDIPGALRSGRVDTNIAPAIWMVGTQMYSVSRYVNSMHIRYAPGLIVLTMDAWNSVPEEYHAKIMELQDDVTAKFVAGIRKDNEKSLQAMLRYGMIETSPEPEELIKIKKALAPVGQEMVGKLYSQEVLDEVTGHLEEYRKSH